MSARTFVPDASILLKWVLRPDDEPDADKARELKSAWMDEACELLVPTLWVWEVGNVVGLKQPALAAPLLQAMLALALPEVAPHEYLDEIVTLMRIYRVTFYDASYHALAIRRRATMLTADAAYVRKAGKAGHVELLSAWRGLP